MLDSLERDLVGLIVDVCNIKGPLPDDLSAESPLIGPDSPLGLDSLDAVEVVVAIQTQYDLRITDRNVLRTLKTLAEHISSRN